MRHQIPLLFNNLHLQYFIMNKLLEMKKKLLGQQAENDKPEIPTKIKKDGEQTPQKDVSFEAESPPNEKQSHQKNIKTSQIAQENLQQGKKEKDQDEKENVSQEQPQKKENLLIERQNVGRQQEPELSQNVQQNIEENMQEEDQIQKEANVEELEKQDLKVNVQAHQYEANLQLNDKNPNVSCSVDEEQRNVTNQEEGQIRLPESKQQKKQKKIILKELQLINKSTKNLKESLKGLQIIQKKMESDPNLKDRLKMYLQELKVLQEGRGTKQNE